MMEASPSRRLGEDMSSETLGFTLLGILTFLVVMTIVFERTQEWMVDVSVPTMKPVVRQTCGAPASRRRGPADARATSIDLERVGSRR